MDTEISLINLNIVGLNSASFCNINSQIMDISLADKAYSIYKNTRIKSLALANNYKWVPWANILWSILCSAIHLSKYYSEIVDFSLWASFSESDNNLRPKIYLSKKLQLKQIITNSRHKSWIHFFLYSTVFILSNSNTHAKIIESIFSFPIFLITDSGALSNVSLIVFVN